MPDRTLPAAYGSQDVKQDNTRRRSISVETRAVDDERRTVELAFSSEAPVRIFGGQEVLDHSRAAVRMDRMNDGAALLVGHNHDDQVGVVESAWIDGDRA